MADTYTTTTRRSYGGRIGDSLKGVLAGIVVFLVSFGLLWWNEGRTVKRTRALAEGEKCVISVASAPVDPANEGKLVHFHGRAVAPGVLADTLFPVVVSNNLQLIRSVEMYQWTETSHSETREKIGGGEETVTTYTYQREWRSNPVDSTSFAKAEGHENPGPFPYEKEVHLADVVTVGAFSIPPETAMMIGEPTSLHIPGTNVPSGFLRMGSTFYHPVSPRPQIGDAEVGDMRITFLHVPEQDASFVAKQVGGSITSYQTKNGDLLLVQDGTVDAEGMFHKAHQDNKVIAWLLRFAGFFLMMTGLELILKPLSVLASVLPFLGRIVRAGTNLVSGLVAAILSLVTISLAWLAFRPLIGVPLLVAAIALAVVLGRKLGDGKEPSHESN